MPRNFYRRIEVVFPLEDPDIRQRIVDILDTYTKDNLHARSLSANGSYRRRKRPNNEAQLVSAQDHFRTQAEQRRQLLEKQNESEPSLQSHTPFAREAAADAGSESPG
jgi:polyphosphate kinase